MRVVQHLDVSANSLFERLVASIAYDASEAKGVEVDPSRIRKGYKYTKTLGKKTKGEDEVKVKITEFEPPYKYSCEFKSGSGTNYISYNITEVDSGVEVEYTEDMDTNQTLGDANYKLMSFLYSRRAKKQIKKMFKDMEQYIKLDKEF